MNIFKSSILFIFGCALLFSACSNEEDAIDTSNVLVKKTFYVGSTGSESRASITAHTEQSIDISWQSTDKISVFAEGHRENNNNQFSWEKKLNTGNTASFTGETYNLTSGQKYYILYPYQESAYLENSQVCCNIPNSQNATEGTFDPAAGIQIGDASSSSGIVDLSHLCAYVFLNVDASCTSIKMKANSTTWHLAGDVKATLGSGGALIQGFGTCQDEITLSGINKAGTYFIAFVPTTGSSQGEDSPSITVTVSGNNKNMSRTIKAGKNMAAGNFYNLGAVSLANDTWGSYTW